MQPSQQNIHVVRYDEVVSTNQIALELGEQGASHGTVITAERQSGGRGRQGKNFSSPPGGLYFSIILRPEGENAVPELLTLAVGVICGRKIEQVSGLEVMLKWPNDLYLQNRKLGGILSETAPFSHQAGRVPFLVVGIGLNINTSMASFPISLKNSAISLAAVRKRKFDLDQIMIDIASEIVQYVSRTLYLKEEILRGWRQRDYLQGRQICWQAADNIRKYGIGAGLLADGRYGLQTTEGHILPILGGEINIIAAGGQETI